MSLPIRASAAATSAPRCSSSACPTSGRGWLSAASSRWTAASSTLVLQFLQPAVQPRFAFTFAGATSVKGIDAWRLDFVERGPPTVVTLNGADVPSRGSVWIARDEGTVLETELAQSNEAIHLVAQIRVTFRRDAALAMWLPVRMAEEYKQQQLGWWGTPPRTAIVNETIECVATYSNFRRFETSGRIVPPPPRG